jgi:hypothetical protein
MLFTKSTFFFDTDYEKEDSWTFFGVNYQSGGLLMPGRSSTANKYRYGYNKGSEKDDEISGEGNHFTTEFREGDTRLLTWWGTDPKEEEQPWQSPYSYMDGNPIKNNDPDGDCPTCFLGGLIGAAVDYGAQVIANSANPNIDNPFTDNINLTSIGISAVEGFLTSGASLTKTVIVKTTAAVINNTVEYKTGSKNKPGQGSIERNLLNVAKNAAIDLSVDAIAGGLSKEGGAAVKKGLSKVGVNSGSVAKITKDAIKSTGGIINKQTNTTIKQGSKSLIKGIEGAANKTGETVVQGKINNAKDKVKSATDRKTVKATF